MSQLGQHKQRVVRTGRRVELHEGLVTVVACLTAALAADQRGHTLNDLFTDAELIEYLTSGAVGVLRQRQEQVFSADEALIAGIRFPSGLDEDASSSRCKAVERECHSS